MFKKIVLLLLIVTIGFLFAEPPGYYDGVVGLSGDALQSALQTLISTNTNSDYDGAKEEMFGYVDNHNNTVRCVYTGQDYSVPQGSMPNQTYLNCEHTFAQSWFGSSESTIKRADIHHLFPTTSNVNSSRGNLPFDIVTSVDNTYTYANGYVSKRGANINGTTCFEPADQHKGDLARALLYFNVRYNESLTQGGINMMETLLAWQAADPVDAAEELRNDEIWNYQNNRNPFVDHPEFIAYIWGTATTDTVIQYMMTTYTVPEAYNSFNISLSIMNPSDQQTTVEVYLMNGDSSDVNGFDFQTVTFPANSTDPQQVSIGITDDDDVEGTESLAFGLRNLVGDNNPILGPTSTFTLTITDDDIPTPTNIAVNNITTSGFSANWDISTAVDSYSLELATDQAFTSYVTGYQGLIVNSSSYAFTGLYPSHTYYLRLRVFHNGTYGDFSDFASVTTEMGSVQFATELFISEYIEGSSYNKAIEIYNGTGMPVDLSQYSLEKDTDGSGEFSSDVDLTGTLAFNDVFIVYNSEAGIDITNLGDMTNNAVINFNGNDQIRLLKNGVELDRIGYQEDVNFAQNVTLVRKLHIDSPTAGPSDPQNNGEWDVYPSDTFEYLGFHDFVGVSNDDDTQPSVSPISISTYPNPFNSVANIDITLKHSVDNISMNVYNLKGQLVNKIYAGRLQSGSHTFNWSTTDDLASGIYFLKTHNGSETQTKKLILVK